MRKFYVCQRNSVSKTIKRHDVSHVMTLLTIGPRPYFPNSFNTKNWIKLTCDDEENRFAPLAPTRELVEHGLDWFKSLPSDASVLVHCEAGVSRSTAMALAGLYISGYGTPDECAKELVRIRPNAAPNRLICKYADDALNLSGSLLAAAEIINADFFKARKIRVKPFLFNGEGEYYANKGQ